MNNFVFSVLFDRNVFFLLNMENGLKFCLCFFCLNVTTKRFFDVLVEKKRFARVRRRFLSLFTQYLPLKKVFRRKLHTGL